MESPQRRRIPRTIGFILWPVRRFFAILVSTVFMWHVSPTKNRWTTIYLRWKWIALITRRQRRAAKAFVRQFTAHIPTVGHLSPRDRNSLISLMMVEHGTNGACIFAATRLPLCLLRLLIVVNFYRNNNNKIVSLVDSYGTAACVHLSQSMATRTNTRQTKRKRNVTSERYECAASVKPLPPPPSPRTNACRATKLFSLQFLSLLCARWRIFISFRLLVRHMRTGCPRSNMHRAIDWRPQSAFLYTIFMFEM